MKQYNPVWFYNLMQAISEKYNWHLDNGKIRATNELEQEFCPITAAYDNRVEIMLTEGMKLNGDRYYRPEKALVAGHLLGMKLDIMNVIIDSCDNVRNKESFYSKNVRESILKSLSL